MSFKNYLIYLFTSFVRFFHSKQKQPKERFLIVSTTALGDTLWATPSIRALRQKYPHAYIAVLTSPIGKAVLEYNRHIDELFILQKPFLLRYVQIYRALKKKQIDTVFIFHTSQRFVLPFCSLLGPRQIIGSSQINKGLDFLLTHPIPLQPEHEIQRRLAIISQTGTIPLSPHMEINLHPKDLAEADAFLSVHQLPSFLPLIGLHPGAKDKFKQWDPDCFIEVGNRLARHIGAKIIVTGTPIERPLVQYIAERIQGALTLPDAFSLRALAALMKKLSLFISNDTGPMHVAYAMGTPTVSLFTATHSQLCGPYFVQDSIVIQKQKTCSPCIRKKCREPFCLLQITPQEVYDAALKLFYQHKEKAL
jgi:ADP-heptose:LPS heptosyltransferase